MIRDSKIIVVDLDGTLARAKRLGESYAEVMPVDQTVARLKALRQDGWHIIIHSSREMRTYEGDLGLIMANTAPIARDWLARHGIRYDVLRFGKPWCGYDGFCVDDRTIRPREFVELSIEEIAAVLRRDSAF